MAERKSASKYYVHPEYPLERQIPVGDSTGTDAMRHGAFADGARGHRVLILQSPDHASNLALDGSRETKFGTPITTAYAGQEAYRLALRSVQGQPYYFAPYATYAVAVADRSGELWCAREDENIQDLYGNMIDCDWHSHPVASTQFADAESVWAYVRAYMTERGLPPLNQSGLTGRGLLFGYGYHPVPAYWRNPTTKEIRKGRPGALGRWRIVQAYLYSLFAHLSSDTSTLQPGHFFKLPGSPNMKNGQIVRKVCEPEGDLYTFNLLCNELWPHIKRAYLDGALDSHSLDWPKSWVSERARQRAGVEPAVANVVSLSVARATRKRAVGKKGKVVTPQAIGEIVWSARVDALLEYYDVLIKEGRASGELRQKLLFLIAVSLSWIDPALWRSEFLKLVIPLTHFRDKEALNRVCTVISRVGMLHRGETKFFAGEECDPRYRFTNAKIRSTKWLDLGDADIRKYPFLSCIGSSEIQKEIHQERQNAQRREVGRNGKPTTGKIRSVWSEDFNLDAPRVQSLRAGGMKIRGIIVETGYSSERVQRLLKVDVAAAPAVAESVVVTMADVRQARKVSAAPAQGNRVKEYVTNG